MIAYLTVLGIDVKVNYTFSKGWCGSREEPPEPNEYDIDTVEYDHQEYENLEINDFEFDKKLIQELEKHHADEEAAQHMISMLDD